MPNFDQALAISTVGVSDNGSEKTVAEVGGRMGKAGAGREPGGKWAEGTLSQVRESRRNVLARTKGSWKQMRNRKWWQAGRAALVLEWGLAGDVGCGGRHVSMVSHSGVVCCSSEGWLGNR